MRGAGWLLLCALLGACLDDLDVRGTPFACATDDDCLSGCACVPGDGPMTADGTPSGVCRCAEADTLEPSPDACAGACGGCEDGTVCLEGACTPLCVFDCPPGSGLARFDGCRCPVMPARSAFGPAEDDAVPCTDSGQRWAAALSEGLGHADAATHCQDLGPTWRLPSVAELIGALDLSAPCETGALGWDEACDGLWLWTRDAPDVDTAWAVALTDLRLQALGLGSGAHAWCVEERTAADTTPRFVRTERGPVLDRVTGLRWQAKASCAGCGWADAQAACQALEGGWRLPELKELFSLTGEGLMPACELDAPFDWLARCDGSPWAWTSTPSPDTSVPGAQLSVSLIDGALSPRPITETGLAICVE
jgi:hypothetical protein